MEGGKYLLHSFGSPKNLSRYFYFKKCPFCFRFVVISHVGNPCFKKQQNRDGRHKDEPSCFRNTNELLYKFVKFKHRSHYTTLPYVPSGNFLKCFRFCKLMRMVFSFTCRLPRTFSTRSSFDNAHNESARTIISCTV